MSDQAPQQLTSQLIVFETKPFHASALAKVSTLELREVRSLFQLRQATTESPHGVIAIEMTAENLIQALTLVAWAKSTFSKPSPAIIALPRFKSPTQTHAPLLLAMHEVGVDVVFRSNLDLGKVELLIRNQSRLRPNSNEIPTLSTRERIWRQLPWKRHDTGGRSQREKGNNG